MEDLEEPVHFGCGIGCIGGGLDRLNKGSETGKVRLVLGLDDSTEDDDKWYERGEEKSPVLSDLNLVGSNVV